jgi:hypothetical protein
VENPIPTPTLPLKGREKVSARNIKLFEKVSARNIKLFEKASARHIESLQNTWSPIFAGVTTFYESIKIKRRPSF